MNDTLETPPSGPGNVGPARIRAFALVGETLGEIYRRRRALVKIAAVPAAVWALFGFVQLYMITQMLRNGVFKASVHGGESWLPTTFTVSGWLVNAILASGLAIACHRLLLLRTMPKSALGFDFGWREVRYIGYGVLIAIVAFAPFYLGMMLFLMLALGGAPSHAHVSPLLGMAVGLFFIGAFIFTYMAFVRLSLVVPAIAVDAGAGLFSRLKRAWRLGRPAPWRLTGAWMMITLIIGLVLIGPEILGGYIYGFYGGSAVLAIAFALGNVIVTILFAFMFSLAYRRLGGEISEPAPSEA
ncbi:hypothetical protein [Varunaivibrio sulfuroxidans]|uniref:Glycerophosphoryl diester phosphodiesterase family protein n=1 Tax=Varunaivibrio sulfuroxidans TaxID=1773489 RepID=A0A4R3J9K2_9PROT|nr:hypothetical protein [Varunaivibrio sulfuroxidans]TCS61633.1 hypothetical protein EDD55_10742 [Varunaivibrio sulfuroxidans]WES29495.1 hypothetical protein P3M64_07420 [Varunaivibrio sulfuroxidans]